MDEPATFRILLLGKSGNGKSSLANTIFGETLFKVKNFNELSTFVSDVKTKCVKGRNLTLIDTPGYFDQGISEDEAKPELMRCFTECAPGPHVFLLVLKMERYTEQEQAIIDEILQYFSEDALKYAVVVFTHGDQLPEGMKIREYVNQSEGLRSLVEKCGGRCHVFDCKYWKNSEQENDYRSNQFQVSELLITIDKMLMENTGGFYTNAVLEEVEREIQEEAQRLKLSSNNTSDEEIRTLAKSNILKKQMKNAALWIKGSVVAIVGLLGVVSAWLINSRIGPSVAASVVHVGEPISALVAKAGEAVVTSAVEAGEPITAAVAKAGEAVATSAVEAGEEIVTSIVEAGKELVPVIVEVSEPITASIAKAGEAVVSSMVEAGEEIVPVIVEASEPITASIAKAGEAVATSAVEAGEEIVTSIVEAGEEIGQSVLLPFSGIFQAAREGPWVLLEALTALFERTYDPYDSFV